MSNLPEIDFVDKSVDQILTSLVSRFEQRRGVTLYPGDPRRMLLQGVAQQLSSERVNLDFTGKQNLLNYASGEFLDELGVFVDVERLEPQPSLTTIQFTLSESQPSVYTIPSGFEVTDGRFIFETIEVLDISAGNTTGSVTAQCQTAGTTGNGILPGRINTQVQPLALISAVTNTTETNGGADQESDENMRERIKLAPGKFSVAGSRQAYEYWARTANQSIVDVSIDSPAPVEVDVYPLISGGIIPGQETLDLVDSVLSADLVRPLTDMVTVSAPTAVNYTINIQYWIARSDSASSITIQNNVESAIETYRQWQRAKIGRDINPDELIRRVKEAGAKRVTVVSPVETVVSTTEVAQDDGSATVAFQGLEDD